MNIFGKLKIRTRQKGSITLTYVIIITAVLLSAGVTLIYLWVDTASTTKDFNSSVLLEFRARSCLEESLYKLRFNPTYTGNVSATFTNGDSGTCTANIQNDPGDPLVKIITIEATLGEYNHNETKKVDMKQNPPKLI